MSRRKGEDAAAKKRRRMPFQVVIEREDRFCRADIDEIDAECRRITNGAEFYRGLQRLDGRYRHVVNFSAQHQAEAFRDAAHWGGYARRPVPPNSAPRSRNARHSGRPCCCGASGRE